MTLEKLLKKYQKHPHFLNTRLLGVNQQSALNDTPLHIAARKGEIEDVVALLKFGAKVNTLGDRHNTPLHFAAMSGNTEVVKALLNQGADKNLLNQLNQTPKRIAQIGGHTRVLDLL